MPSGDLCRPDRRISLVSRALLGFCAGTYVGRSGMRRVIAGMVGCVAFASFHTAVAWGPEGHGLTATIAEPHLTPAAKAEVERLLKLENHSRLDEVSSWADAVRGARPDTAPG